MWIKELFTIIGVLRRMRKDISEVANILRLSRVDLEARVKRIEDVIAPKCPVCGHTTEEKLYENR